MIFFSVWRNHLITLGFLFEYQCITSPDHRDILKYSLYSFRGKLVMIDCYKTLTLILLGQSRKILWSWHLKYRKKETRKSTWRKELRAKK